MSIKENAVSGAFISILNKAKESEIFWVVSFSILTAFSAQVAIPVLPVPFTLQTMIVLLAGAFLGAKNGALSQLLYLGMGAIGFPVFSGLSLGVATLFGPTGGYLIAFPVVAYLVGYILERKNNIITITISMTLGALIILFSGALYLTVFFNGSFKEAFFAGVVIFSVWDLLKIAAAISIYKTLSKKYSKLPA